MKFRTPFCSIEFEYLFLIFSFVCLFSLKTRIYFSNFFVCYLFIVFHELSHVLVASLFGKKLELIRLSISGVNAKFEREKFKLDANESYFFNILIYFAGPFSNILLAIIFHNVEMIYEINLSLAIINLFPIYPLDGYNILKNVLGTFNSKYNYLNIIQNLLLFFLFLLSIYQFFYFKSITIFVFSIYILLIKCFEKNASK